MAFTRNEKNLSEGTVVKKMRSLAIVVAMGVIFPTALGFGPTPVPSSAETLFEENQTIEENLYSEENPLPESNPHQEPDAQSPQREQAAPWQPDSESIEGVADSGDGRVAVPGATRGFAPPHRASGHRHRQP
jgi:hypothetical protein